MFRKTRPAVACREWKETREEYQGQVQAWVLPDPWAECQAQERDWREFPGWEGRDRRNPEPRDRRCYQSPDGEDQQFSCCKLPLFWLDTRITAWGTWRWNDDDRSGRGGGRGRLNAWINASGRLDHTGSRGTVRPGIFIIRRRTGLDDFRRNLTGGRWGGSGFPEQLGSGWLGSTGLAKHGLRAHHGTQ